MRRMQRWVVLSTLGSGVAAVLAIPGIPEPDMVLYGDVCRGGTVLPSSPATDIVARTAGPSGPFEVGRYRMGDNPLADDCDGTTDCYVLRVRLESLAEGLTPSGTAVVLDKANPNTIQIFLLEPGQPERQVAEVLVNDRGIIRRLDLNTTPATTDLNGDGSTTRADYPLLQADLRGPAVTPSDPCGQTDLNRDGRVDLKDFSVLQNAVGD